MKKERIYPEKKARDLKACEKDAIRRDLSGKKLSSLDISKKHHCSYSQVCGIKAAVTMGR